MNDIVLDKLYPLQKELDKKISEEHGVDYQSTHVRRLLALLVEIGEFANETRCFKYWSEKPAGAKERILDEYADGMHFFLSLGIPLGIERFSHSFATTEKDLPGQIVSVFVLASQMNENYDAAHYKAAFGAFLDILPLIGASPEEAIKAYQSKLAVNYKRQENHY